MSVVLGLVNFLWKRIFDLGRGMEGKREGKSRDLLSLLVSPPFFLPSRLNPARFFSNDISSSPSLNTYIRRVVWSAVGTLQSH